MHVFQQVGLTRPVFALDHEHVAVAAREVRKRLIQHRDGLLATEGE